MSTDPTMTQVNSLRRQLVDAIQQVVAERDQARARLTWLLEHAHVVFHTLPAEGSIQVLSVEALDEAIAGR